MPLQHTKSEIIKKLTAAAIDMAEFYQQGFVNYSGNTSDTGEPYSEIVAGYLLENPDLWNGIKTITRTASYKMEHKGIQAGDAPTCREEEWLAKSMFGNTYDAIGEVIDYQTPLKDSQGDKAGKIDLLSKPDDKTLYLIELKKEDNGESLLRCVLEAYTYSKVVDGKKLLADFGLAKDTKIVPVVAIFKDKKQHGQMELPKLSKLMETLGVKVVVLSNTIKVEETK